MQKNTSPSKHMIFEFDEEDSEQQSPLHQRQMEQKITQVDRQRSASKKKIDSIEAFTNHLEQKQNNRSIQQQSLDSSIVSNSEILSSQAMQNSVVRLVGDRKGKSSIHQSAKGSLESQPEDESNDSPVKLKNLSMKQAEKVSLLQPPENLKDQSIEYSRKLFKYLEGESVNLQRQSEVLAEFINKPLPSLEGEFARYHFEIHFYKYTFAFYTTYQLWLCNEEGDMIRILKSDKDSFSLSSSHLVFQTVPSDPKKQKFAAKLKYNTAKTQYNMYDCDQKESPNKDRRFICSLFYTMGVTQDRALELFVPKSEFSQNDFIKDQKHSNLSSFIQQGQSDFYKQIEKLTSKKPDSSQEMTLKKEYELKQNEGRTVLLVDEQGTQKLYMAKKQSQRYLVLAAHGLSPLQIFAAAVANLDH